MKKNMNTRKGFTLVEMLGVLAIIAILISVIAVGVMSAINRARIVATVANFKNLETAVVGFVALPNSGGTVPLTKGPNTPIDTYNGTNYAQVAADGTYTLDQVLRASGLIDRPLSWRVGTDGLTQMPLANEQIFMLSRNAWADGVAVNGVTTTTPENVWDDYNHCDVAAVNGATTVVNTQLNVAPDTTGVNFFLDGTSKLNASRVAYVVLKNVSLKDAQKLSSEINGTLDDSEVAAAGVGQYRGRLIYGAPNTANLVDVYYYLASF